MYVTIALRGNPINLQVSLLTLLTAQKFSCYEQSEPQSDLTGHSSMPPCTVAGIMLSVERKGRRERNRVYLKIKTGMRGLILAKVPLDDKYL